MPSQVFPRNSLWLPLTVTDIVVPASRRTITQSGKIQTRTKTAAGRIWTETYPPIRAKNVDVENLLSWVRWAWNEGQEFTVQHLLKPGSGVPPNGTGQSGIQVDGSGQTGTTINSKLWSNNITNVVRAGDLIKLAGIQRSFEVTEDANSNGSGLAAIKINPAVYVGGSPANSAAITTTGATMNAVIMDFQGASIANSFWYDGMTITFRESP